MQTPEPMPQEPKARLLVDLTQNMPNIPCKQCGHPLVLHDGYDGSSTSTKADSPPHMKTEPHIEIRQGLSTPSNELVDGISGSPSLPPGDADELPAELCHRESTVRKIAQKLMEGESVLIWGTKGTGKTTLANYLYEILISENWKVILIPSMPDATKKKVEEILLEHARDKFSGSTNEDLLKDLIFIIDEAQDSLKTSRLRSAWSNLIKASQSSDAGPRFCIISDQGVVPESNTVFADLPEVSHLPTHASGDGQSSLFFTIADFEEYFQRNRGLFGFELDQEAACHVHSLTAGHPTILKLIMHYIKIRINQADAENLTPMPTLSRPDVMAIMHNEDQLFSYLGGNVYPGELARVSKPVVQVFKKLLDSPEEKIGWSAAPKTTIEKCFSSGLIIYEIDEKMDENDPGRDFFRFPSPLHAK
ncbi:hypothetical protein DPV78_012097 [Talaromyces pinophilus]|nr:hypothetical protein DPV78_012097 [Talaromyces pinophilus]